MDRDHLTPTEWTAYRGRELPPAEMLQVSDHLAECAECAAQREVNFPSAQVEWPALTNDLPPASYEEIAAWVDGRMENPVDREIFQGRLLADPQSRREVENLGAFKSAMNRLPPREHKPSNTLPANVVEFPRSSPFAWLLPLAAAALVMLAMLAGSVFGPSQLQIEVESALAAGTLDLPALPEELRPSRGVLAGESEAVALAAVRPIAQRVRELQPRLRWISKPDRADAFLVTMQRTDTGDILTSGTLPASARDWTPSQPLARGAVYEWQVQALRNGVPIDQAPRPPAPEARFQVLDAGAEAKLRKTLGEAGGSALLQGMAFAQAGLIDEADARWREAGAPGTRLRAELQSSAAR